MSILEEMQHGLLMRLHNVCVFNPHDTRTQAQPWRVARAVFFILTVVHDLDVRVENQHVQDRNQTRSQESFTASENTV